MDENLEQQQQYQTNIFTSNIREKNMPTATYKTIVEPMEEDDSDVEIEGKLGRRYDRGIETALSLHRTSFVDPGYI